MLFGILSRRAAEFCWLRPTGPVPDEPMTGLRRMLRPDFNSLKALAGEMTHPRCSFMPLPRIIAAARRWRAR